MSILPFVVLRWHFSTCCKKCLFLARHFFGSKPSFIRESRKVWRMSFGTDEWFIDWMIDEFVMRYIQNASRCSTLLISYAYVRLCALYQNFANCEHVCVQINRVNPVHAPTALNNPICIQAWRWWQSTEAVFSSWTQIPNKLMSCFPFTKSSPRERYRP